MPFNAQAEISQKIEQTLNKVKLKMPNVEVIKDIKTGIDFKPLTKKQIEIVKENFVSENPSMLVLQSVAYCLL